MIKEGVTDEHKYNLASLLVCTLYDKKIGGAAIGSDGERELRRLEPNIERVLNELHGYPASVGFRYQPIGTIDLSHETFKYENPEQYFVQPTDKYPLREVRGNSTTLEIPDDIDILLLFDLGSESLQSVKSTLNYRPIYMGSGLVTVSVVQDNTNFVPYAGVRDSGAPYRKDGLISGLNERLPGLVAAMKREGILPRLLTKPPTSRLYQLIDDLPVAA